MTHMHTCIALLHSFSLFLRFAAGFILEMEKHELHRQWTWEPKMAECLIILLIDPDHVRALTNSNQFLSYRIVTKVYTVRRN